MLKFQKKKINFQDTSNEAKSNSNGKEDDPAGGQNPLVPAPFGFPGGMPPFFPPASAAGAAGQPGAVPPGFPPFMPPPGMKLQKKVFFLI